MPVAYFTVPGMKVSLSGERLEIQPPRGAEEQLPRQGWIPLVDVERVVVDSAVHMSSRTVTGLLERDIPVLFTRHGNSPAGVALPLRPRGNALVEQLDATRDAEFRLCNARALIDAKIRNMRRVLQRLGSNRGQTGLAGTWLGAMANQAVAAASLDSLRGIEGAATGRYFEVLATYFPTDVPFERRSRRPPLNEANALLSFGYTLLATECTQHLHFHGLEPGWGVMHEQEDGRPALALDMVEPYRAPVVDALVLDLLNHRRLKKGDFERSEAGGYLLKRESRRLFYAAWEERMEREFHYEAENRRTSLRGLIADHTMGLKAIFRERGQIKPFIMN